MKKALTFFSTFIAILLCASFAAPASPEGIVIKIKKGNVTVQGAKITPGWSLSTFKSALDEPERTRDGYNKTHTYDKFSIVLFEPVRDKKPTGQVTEFQLHFSVPDPNEVTPKGDGFKGTFKVDKLTVTENLTPDEMMKKLKGWKKTDSYIEHSYRMAYKSVYIYFQFNDSETMLIKTSIGINKD
jgi:hypothetical protein